MLQQIPREYMQRILGKHGDALWRHAHGIDERPVVPYSEAKSVSTECTFREDTIDIRGLRATIAAMAEKIAFKLRSKQQLASVLTVKIRYADFSTLTKQLRIPYTAADHYLSHKALEIFEKLYDRRLRVRLVGVRLSGLVHGGYQIDLFEDTSSQIRLYEAVDKIKFRYGAAAVMRGNTIGSLGRRAG